MKCWRDDGTERRKNGDSEPWRDGETELLKVEKGNDAIMEK